MSTPTSYENQVTMRLEINPKETIKISIPKENKLTIKL